jgi:hypothetical protein
MSSALFGSREGLLRLFVRVIGKPPHRNPDAAANLLSLGTRARPTACHANVNASQFVMRFFVPSTSGNFLLSAQVPPGSRGALCYDGARILAWTPARRIGRCRTGTISGEKWRRRISRPRPSAPNATRSHAKDVAVQSSERRLPLMAQTRSLAMSAICSLSGEKRTSRPSRFCRGGVHTRRAAALVAGHGSLANRSRFRAVAVSSASSPHTSRERCYCARNLDATISATMLAKISSAGRDFRVIGLVEWRAADRPG